MSATASTDLSSPATGRRHLISSLRLDALLSGAMGLLLALGAPFLEGRLGAPVSFLVPLGIFLVAYAGSLLLIARADAPRPLVLAVIAGNAAWAAASVAAVLWDWLTLTTLGNALTIAQAAAVAILAEIQLVYYRRPGRS